MPKVFLVLSLTLGLAWSVLIPSLRVAKAAPRDAGAAAMHLAIRVGE